MDLRTAAIAEVSKSIERPDDQETSVHGLPLNSSIYVAYLQEALTFLCKSREKMIYVLAVLVVKFEGPGDQPKASLRLTFLTYMTTFLVTRLFCEIGGSVGTLIASI